MTTVLRKTANDVILGALRKASIIRPRQTAQPEDLDTGLELLNLVFKRWEKDTHLWLQREGTVFLNCGQEKYSLGEDGDNACPIDNLIDTELTVAAVDTDTQITVDDTTGMSGASDPIVNNLLTPANWTTDDITATSTITFTLDASTGTADYSFATVVGDTYRVTLNVSTNTVATSHTISVQTTAGINISVQTLPVSGQLQFTFEAETTDSRFFIELSGSSTQLVTIGSFAVLNLSDGDIIGLQLDDGTRYWDRILSVDSTTTLTFLNAITGSDAAINSTVYTYDTPLERPLRVYTPRTQTTNFSSEVMIEMWSRQEYMFQVNKETTGFPVQVYYSPQLIQGEMYLWPTASSVNQRINFTYDRSIAIVEQTDFVELPDAWLDYCEWSLAYQLCGEYQVPPDKVAWIQGQLMETKIVAEAYDDQLYGDVQLGPDYQYA